jgi:hypothetical protein
VFVDIEIDGWLRLNGLNLLRDGAMRSSQLTPLINGKRCFIDAVEVVDPDLRASLTAAIKAAITEYAETLPLEQRVKPPRPPEPRREEPRPDAAVTGAKRGNAPASVKPASATLLNAKPVTTKQPGRPILPPPTRLLVRRT